jgi:hypothetical protein
MRARGVPVLVVLLAALVAALAAQSAPSVLPRTTTDRPDDVGGPQVHVVYAVPRGGEDRRLDVSGVLAGTVASWSGWLRGQTGGAGLRLDTSGGELDVSFFQVPLTDDEMVGKGAFVRDELERELREAGLLAAGKLYAVYYDGKSTYGCGGGAWPPALPGVVAAMYLHGLSGTGFDCDRNPFAGATNPPGYMDFAMLHELMHTLGFVPTCAPHHTRAGHASDSPTDLMYAGDEAWRPAVLDVGRDDYYRAHIAGCPDFADSPFLDSTPPPVATTTTTTTMRTTTTTRPKAKPPKKKRKPPLCKRGQRPRPGKPCRRR